jgi:hypothetical protein
MTIEILQKELQQSIKDKNRVRKNVIADIITCAKNAAIASGRKDEISEDIVNAAVLKSKKICQEQIDTCPENRPDILEAYKLCMTYIDEFAPKMMNEEEVKKAVYFLLSTVDMPTNNKGDIMKRIMPNLKGKADGKLINKVVTEILEESK